MQRGALIEVSKLTKRFGAVTAVDDVSFVARPGEVTGFLGPNGAGKTTTLRMLLGLVAPSAGRATIGGERYLNLSRPLARVGAALEASSFHPGRTARAHVRVCAVSAGIPRARADDVLELVGLGDHADRRVGTYSLGMRQRLALAVALLGDPDVLVLDEPANGLDPAGIRWMRELLRTFAEQGRTVLVSSHLLGEVQQVADALVVIARGACVFTGTPRDIEGAAVVIADSRDRAALDAALLAAGVTPASSPDGLRVSGLSTVAVGEIAHHAGVPLSLLVEEHSGLEQAFLDLVSGERA